LTLCSIKIDDPKTGKSYLFGTSMACRSMMVLTGCRQRWASLVKTTSTDYTVRLLYYAVASEGTGKLPRVV
jgi:hypothetical protein